MQHVPDLTGAILDRDHLGTHAVRRGAGSPARVLAEQGQTGQVTEAFESSHLILVGNWGKTLEGTTPSRAFGNLKASKRGGKSSTTE